MISAGGSRRRSTSFSRGARASRDSLEDDHSFLLEGDVFTSDLIGSYIRHKREAEVDAIRLRAHPWEFALYHDA